MWGPKRVGLGCLFWIFALRCLKCCWVSKSGRGTLPGQCFGWLLILRAICWICFGQEVFPRLIFISTIISNTPRANILNGQPQPHPFRTPFLTLPSNFRNSSLFGVMNTCPCRICPQGIWCIYIGDAIHQGHFHGHYQGCCRLPYCAIKVKKMLALLKETRST